MDAHSEKVDDRKSKLRQKLRNLIGKVRKTHLKVTALVVLGFMTLGSWSLASSVGSSPDDQAHMASIWCSGFAGEECMVEEGSSKRLVPAQLMEAMCTTQAPLRSASCQPLLSFNDGRLFGVKNVNTRTELYPTGYYKTQNLLVQDNFEHAILGMRLFNSLIFISLLAATLIALPPRLRQPLTWAWLLSTIPLGLFLIASINPSSWAIASVGLGWFILYGFFQSSGWRSVLLGILYLITAVMAFSSRTDSAVFFLATTLLAVFLSRTDWRTLVKRIWLPTIPIAVAVANLVYRGYNNVGQLGVAVEGIGNRSLRKFGEPSPWAKGSNSEPTGEFDWNLLWNNIWDAPGLWLGFVGGWPWGSLGWLDTLLPQFVPFAMMSTIAGVVFLSIQGGARWKKVVAVTGMVLSAWALTVYLHQIGGLIVGEKFQPRYLLPILVVLITVVILEDHSRRKIFINRGSRLTMWLAIVSAHAISLHTQIRRYVTGFSDGGLDLGNNIQWWWASIPGFLGPNVVWILGSVGFAIVAYVVIVTPEDVNLKPQSKEIRVLS